MNTATRHVLRFAVFFLVLMTNALAQQSVIRVGDRYQGALRTETEVDQLGFEAFAGTLLSVSARSREFVPSLEILDATTGQAVGMAALGKIKKRELPSTGFYWLRIASGDGSHGVYDVATKAKKPRDAKGIKGEFGPSMGGPIQVEFPGLPGTVLSGSVRPGRGSQAVPSPMITIESPGGGAVLNPTTSTGPRGVQIAPTVLEAFGTHRMTIENQGGLGTLAIKLKLKQSK